MKQFAFIFFIIAIFSFEFFSCSKDPSPTPDMGYNYFPNQVGKYVVYDVDSIYKDIRTDTFKFQIKEKIESIFMDNQNRPTIRLERYKKNYNPSIPYSSMAWIFQNVWTENRTNTTAEKVEDNIRYIKLAFPIKQNQSWNGNAQNIFDKWTYTYDYFDVAKSVGNLQFDSVLQVNQFDDESQVLTQRQFYVEKYARNVGMIYKKIIDVESQPNSIWPTLPYGQDSIAAFFSKPILQRITFGLQYTATVNSYGIE